MLPFGLGTLSVEVTEGFALGLSCLLALLSLRFLVFGLGRGMFLPLLCMANGGGLLTTAMTTVSISMEIGSDRRDEVGYVRCKKGGWGRSGGVSRTLQIYVTAKNVARGWHVPAWATHFARKVVLGRNNILGKKRRPSKRLSVQSQLAESFLAMTF